MESPTPTYDKVDLSIAAPVFDSPNVENPETSASARQNILTAANAIAEQIKEDPSFDVFFTEEKYKEALGRWIGHLEQTLAAPYWQGEDLSNIEAGIAIGKQKLG